VERESKMPDTTRLVTESALYVDWMPMPMATPTGVVNAKMSAMAAYPQATKSACQELLIKTFTSVLAH
jgi:hypothetical protein